MTSHRIGIKLAGQAGQGVESNGELLARAIARGGVHLFAKKEYESRIRGGLNHYQIHAGEDPIASHQDKVHLLIAQTPEAVPRYGADVLPGGGVLYDEALHVNTEILAEAGIKAMPAPLTKIAVEQGGHKVMAGTASGAIAAALFDWPLELVLDTVQRQFGHKGSKIIDGNRAVASAAYDMGKQLYPAGLGVTLLPVADAPQRMLLDGNQALAFGALAAGCNFFAAYPMTPGTSIFEWLAAHGDEHGVVVKHTEDEIAAVNMIIGASHMGARSMTSTSGGGFALMVEGISFAGMLEAPIVLVLAQRPGPATGLATRTEQADLPLALGAGHGDFPRLILAPGTHEQCFRAGWRAFNLAERYQTPVVVMTDHFLATSSRTVDLDAFDLGAVTRDRGALLEAADLDALEAPFERYPITESGISPRVVPGHPGAVFTATGNEHTSTGLLTEDMTIRTEQHAKRLRKLETAREEIEGPRWHGPPAARTTLLCWGSSWGPVSEAVDRLNGAGQSVNMLHFADLWPLPREAAQDALDAAGRLVAVENNATAQWAHVLRGELGVEVDGHLLRWDGRPLSPDYIVERFGGEE